MTVVLARVDQRLVHGIVVNQWAAEVQPKRYMVIDDAVSQDEDVKASMRLSKPAGTGMSIIDTEKALTNFKAGKYDAQLSISVSFLQKTDGHRSANLFPLINKKLLILKNSKSAASL